MNVFNGHETFAMEQREFAIQVVQILRGRGHEAYWAGGCVRDQLLGKRPKDYDVATTARPDQVIEIFGRRRTVPVGASFGVILVLGPTAAAGQVEVATFRRDGPYQDGRRPDSVEYCRPEEDAKRRDFTINGLFFDPVSNEVIDYVDGRADLNAGIVRAIGDPDARFHEDKLRMLRAVRFAAILHFQLDSATADAIRRHCAELTQVSEERIAQELRRMLGHRTRGRSVRMLEETGLLPFVFPEIASRSGLLPSGSLLDALEQLELERFESAMSILLMTHYVFPSGDSHNQTGAQRVHGVCRRLKLSNQESGTICWILEKLDTVSNISQKPLHILKPLLAHQDSLLLIDVAAALSTASGKDAADAEFCRQYLDKTPEARLSPPPLILGGDVMALGIPAGPAVRTFLTTIRNEQLDELISTRDQALRRLAEIVKEHQ